MDEELERIADLIAARIRAQVAEAAAPVVPKAGAPASPCSASVQCSGCGRCVQHREHEVRSLRDHGAARVAAAPGVATVAHDLAGAIDHTLLKPEATAAELEQLCGEARQFSFASVCVNSVHVPRCRSLLHGSPVMVCAVVGFPLGAMAPGAKAFEAREAVRAGADEIDMVMNVGALRDGNYGLALEDISKVVAAARPARVKVILETSLLTDEQKVAACTLAKLAGAHFVKTSTGFGKGGATAKDVALMRRVVGPTMGVKASGGIRSREDALQMVEAGATRIGASASVAIVTGKGTKASH